ncbi:MULTISPECIES: hypothetical protein [Acinetobacter]|jgi:hypothetical protein|uniref:hypothetical protein n=1 Tax=Acinetobacter TaxID=469 RepID=UPI0006FA746D|nr:MULTISPECIES: hypothetical protein [unclassified Acinetobacter]KQX03802.1 hypothetical protein ASC84_03620 [Acinetobacter sp. Root1280]QLD59930.1 hypothetical protein CQZ96_001115 [Acinetobacter sp. MYb10]
MRKFKDYFQKLYSSFPVENILNSLVVIISASTVFLAILALTRPINPDQYKYVVQYSQQAANPKTQKIAHQLRSQDRIYVVEYLRLLRAYHFENQQVKRYPAVDSKDPQ